MSVVDSGRKHDVPHPGWEGQPTAGARSDCGSASLPRSVVGIPTCESLVQLQPRQSYTIYVRALNMGGPSARSEPVTVHTTGLCPLPHTLWDPRRPLCGRPSTATISLENKQIVTDRKTW